MKIRIIHSPIFKNYRQYWQDRKARRHSGAAVPAEEHPSLDDIPENPEVSSRLSNLSLRHTGSRPEWFDFEPLQLPGRTRQCRQLFWQITESHRKHVKQMFLLRADSGTGKTTFLSQLYAMLEHAPENVLTLAPGSPVDKPFQAIRNILEQRFYISGEATFSSIERFVTGAVNAIVPKEHAGETSDCLLELWRPVKIREIEKKAAAVSHAAPPPIATQIVSMEDIINEHKKKTAELKSIEERNNIVHTPSDAVETTSIASDCTADDIRSSVSGTITAESHVLTSDDILPQDTVPEIAVRSDDESEKGDREISIEIDLDEIDSDESGGQAATIMSTADNPGDTRLRSAESDHTAEPRNCDISTPETIAALRRQALRIQPALTRFFLEDLKHNPIVIIIDDIEKFDDISLELISSAFHAMPDSRLTILLTTSLPPMKLPLCLKMHCTRCMKLDLLSDTDLIILTKHVIKTLSQSREKLIIPHEICRQVAQRAYGSPKRAIDMALKYLAPEHIIKWNSAIAKIRSLPLPGEIGHTIVERFRACSEQEKFILHIASHLNAPFTIPTIQCIMSGIDDIPGKDGISCKKVFRQLQDKNFFERAEESFSQPTVSYVFRHDCERLVIAASTRKSLCRQIYANAAQWYTLNNSDHAYDEIIGDLWREHQSVEEACNYYETAAYRAFQANQYTRAWPLFRKLIQNLPDSNIARKISVTLDTARVAFRIGFIDEAFKLCRWSGYRALRISAHSRAAQANIQIAEMLVELGSIRHVMRFIKRARCLLAVTYDRIVQINLDLVTSHYEICRSQFKKASEFLESAAALIEKHDISDSTRLIVEWTRAVIEAKTGQPLEAIAQFQDVISKAKTLGNRSICAIAHRALGNTYESIENLAAALESWNYALGIAQEMNDVVLHAALLADITNGAIALDAIKTAKAATEQCLAIAQQTRQKKLIAQCLANTARIQYINKHYEKAMRTLRKAHRSACAAKSMPLWTYTLSLLALGYNTPGTPFYNPAQANKIYKNLIGIYKNSEIPLLLARAMPQYASFLIQTHQNMAALNSCRKALLIYQEMHLDKAAEKVQAIIDKITHDISIQNES